MSRLTTCGLTVLLAFAPAALAADGVVLINQSTITTGLPGCPTGGHFPIIICQPGSYRLSGNLTVPDANTDGIDITADNVTIDLNGFSILGPTVCPGINSLVSSCSPSGNGTGILGVFNPTRFDGPENIVLMNGQIKGMGNAGIQLNGSKSEVRNIHATNNGSSGIFVSVLSQVASCTVTSNGGSGIVAGANSVVTGNMVSLNNREGIGLLGAASIISGNSSTINGGIGIVASCSSVISGNISSGNVGSNLVTSGSGCVLVNNAAQ